MYVNTYAYNCIIGSVCVSIVWRVCVASVSIVWRVCVASVSIVWRVCVASVSIAR